MNRKHFEMIAAILKRRRDLYILGGDQKVIDKLAHDFADQLEETNERFDRDRFLNACGVE